MPSSDATQDAPASDLNIHYYWTVIRKRKWLIFGVIVLVTAGMIAWTSQKPRVYQASATVIIDRTGKIVRREIGIVKPAELREFLDQLVLSSVKEAKKTMSF